MLEDVKQVVAAVLMTCVSLSGPLSSTAFAIAAHDHDDHAVTSSEFSDLEVSDIIEETNPRRAVLGYLSNKSLKRDVKDEIKSRLEKSNESLKEKKSALETLKQQERDFSSQENLVAAKERLETESESLKTEISKANKSASESFLKFNDSVQDFQSGIQKLYTESVDEKIKKIEDAKTTLDAIKAKAREAAQVPADSTDTALIATAIENFMKDSKNAADKEAFEKAVKDIQSIAGENKAVQPDALIETLKAQKEALAGRVNELFSDKFSLDNADQRKMLEQVLESLKQLATTSKNPALLKQVSDLQAKIKRHDELKKSLESKESSWALVTESIGDTEEAKKRMQENRRKFGAERRKAESEVNALKSDIAELKDKKNLFAHADNSNSSEKDLSKLADAILKEAGLAEYMSSDAKKAAEIKDLPDELACAGDEDRLTDEDKNNIEGKGNRRAIEKVESRFGKALSALANEINGLKAGFAQLVTKQNINDKVDSARREGTGMCIAIAQAPAQQLQMAIAGWQQQSSAKESEAKNAESQVSNLMGQCSQEQAAAQQKAQQEGAQQAPAAPASCANIAAAQNDLATKKAEQEKLSSAAQACAPVLAAKSQQSNPADAMALIDQKMKELREAFATGLKTGSNNAQNPAPANLQSGVGGAVTLGAPGVTFQQTAGGPGFGPNNGRGGYNTRAYGTRGRSAGARGSRRIGTRGSSFRR